MEAILIKQPPAISFSGNPLPYQLLIEPYGNTEAKQDISLQVKIFRQIRGGQSIEIKNQIFFPKNDGSISFDIQSYADAYLSYYLPMVTQIKPTYCQNQEGIFFIQYLLKKDNTIIGEPVSSNQVYVIKGGIAYHKWNPYDYFIKILTEKLFLNFETLGEKVSPDDIRFLHYLNDNGENANGIKSIITLNDGTTVESFADISNIEPNYINQVICIAAGFNQLGLAAAVPAGKEAVSYSVSVLNGGSVVFKGPFTFELENRNFYNPKIIIYRTSTGALETIRLKALIEFEADYNRKDFQRTAPPAYFDNLNLQAQFLQDSNEESERYKAETGFLSKELADKMRDLFLSPEKFEVRNGKLLPITINNKSVKFYSNKENLISIAFEWRMAYNNNYYTPELLLPLYRTCPAMETFNVTQSSKTTLSVIYAMPIPYDKVEVIIIVSGEEYRYVYTGNTGRFTINIGNFLPSTLPDDVYCKARVICDDAGNTTDAGAWTELVISLLGNSLPVVNDDTFDISNPLGSAYTLPHSVLDNDYDPDGDAIQVIAVTGGTTNQGGIYSINAAGIVTYIAPSTGFAGHDYFDYQVQETGGGTPVTGRCYIDVGITVSNFYVKLVKRNLRSETGNGSYILFGEFWLDYFSDPFGNIPLDITARDITFSVHVLPNTAAGAVYLSIKGIGTKNLVYSGAIFSANYAGSQEVNFEIVPAAGFIII